LISALSQYTIAKVNAKYFFLYKEYLFPTRRCPAHNARIVQNYLQDTFENRVINIRLLSKSLGTFLRNIIVNSN